MSPAGHAFRTWLVAHALHPITMIGWCYIYREDEDLVDVGLLVSLFGPILSIHTIYLFWAALHAFIKSKLSLTTKFVIWIVVAPLLTHIGVMFLYFLFGGFGAIALFDDVFQYSFPAILATILSIIIRYPQFRELIKTVNKDYDKQDVLLP